MKKGIIAFALLLALLPLGMTAHAGELPPISLTTKATRIPGDANGDGNVSLLDVTTTMRYLAGGWGVSINEKNADVNGDNAVDLRDATLLRRYLATGWDVTLR